MNPTPEQTKQIKELIEELNNYNSNLKQFIHNANNHLERKPIHDGHGQNSTDTTKAV